MKKRLHDRRLLLSGLNNEIHDNGGQEMGHGRCGRQPSR